MKKMILAQLTYPLSLPVSALPTSMFIFFLVLLMKFCPSHQLQSELDMSYENLRNVDDYNQLSNSINSKTEAKLKEMGQPPPRPHKNLTCHVCYSDKNPECTNSSLFPKLDKENDEDYYDHDPFPGFPKECPSENYICSVRKFAFSLSNGTGHAPMKTFALKRNCTIASKCEPGCVMMGERTRIYVCTTCCNKDKCNIGDGAKVLKVSTLLSFIWIISYFAINL